LRFPTIKDFLPGLQVRVKTTHFCNTIVAPITGAPPAAVSWVRLSGQDAWEIAAKVFVDWPNPVAPRFATYGRFSFADDGLAIPFEQGHSYTGEQSVELSVHGSRAAVANLVDACIAAGATLAEPGEFTLRAFMNGRIDLTQAEGVRDTCEAVTDRQLRAGARLREGRLSVDIANMRDSLIGLLAALEASVDFSEDIGEFDRANAASVITSVLERVAALIRTQPMGNIVRQGVRIAIIGPPNAGKSTLMNCLLGRERSIITAVPGTTRDFIEESAQWNGIPIVLVDTAGLRETSDPVESIGVSRSRDQANSADEAWYVYDAAIGWTDDDEKLVSQLSRTRIVGNKSDLAKPIRGDAISANTGSGVPELLATTMQPYESLGDGVWINERHEGSLRNAEEALTSLLGELEGDRPDDLLSVLLSQAIADLGEITGETASPDMIEKIFRGFCLGK
jgi:tRNA modification GTPase